MAPSDSLTEITQLLHRAYARLGAMGLNLTAVDQTAQVTAERISEGHCFVAEREGAIIGTVLVRPHDPESESEYLRQPHLAIVNQFAVEPTLQGQGIGRELLAMCEAWARDQGHSEIALDTSEQAVHLTELYSRLGYRHVAMVQWPGKTYRSVVLSKTLR